CAAEHAVEMQTIAFGGSHRADGWTAENAESRADVVRGRARAAPAIAGIAADVEASPAVTGIGHRCPHRRLDRHVGRNRTAASQQRCKNECLESQPRHRSPPKMVAKIGRRCAFNKIVLENSRPVAIATLRITLRLNLARFRRSTTARRRRADALAPVCSLSGMSYGPPRPDLF